MQFLDTFSGKYLTSQCHNMSMKNRLSAIFAPTAQWQTVFSSVRNLFSSCVWHVGYFMVLQVVEFQVLKGSQNPIQAVSDYKERSYKKWRWNFGKQTTNIRQLSKIKYFLRNTHYLSFITFFYKKRLCVDFCMDYLISFVIIWRQAYKIWIHFYILNLI